MVVSVGDFGGGEDGGGGDFYGAGLGLEVEGCGGGGVGGEEGEVDVDAAGLGVNFQGIAEGKVAGYAAGLGGEGRLAGVDGEVGWEFFGGEFDGGRRGTDGDWGVFGDRDVLVEDDIQRVGIDTER